MKPHLYVTCITRAFQEFHSRRDGPFLSTGGVSWWFFVVEIFWLKHVETIFPEFSWDAANSKPKNLRCPRKNAFPNPNCLFWDGVIFPILQLTEPELSLCSRDDPKQQQRIQTLENLTGGYLEILVCHMISLRRILLCDSCNPMVHHAWLIWSFQIRRLDMVGECGWQGGPHVLFIVKYWLVWNTVLLHDADDWSNFRWM